ncbi:MAG: sulfatase [Lewinellaceae bacterium]|nr:sulfatase [Lewinellaceae bacterium]
MKYRLLFLISGLASFLLLGSRSRILPEREAGRELPNIVILFSDDLGYGDLSAYGHPTIRTPNLDRMAAEGMKFTNFYSGSPACSASRYALLTGRFPVRSGFDWVLYPKSERCIHPREWTLAEGLKQAGYATACYGKWHLGTTKKEYLPLQNGFDEYVGLPYSNDMLPPQHPPIALMEGNDTLQLNPDQTQLTALYTARAKAFIRKHKKEPFFVYLPYAMPHVPLHPGEKFAGRSPRGAYGDVVEEIDWSAGEILELLKAEGLDKNTLVFFTSDNGPWIIKNELGGSAGLLRDGKGSTWEGGMREPGIAWWPGTIEAGALQLQPASTLDLYTTCLALAGQGPPEDGRSVDGRDISSLLLGEMDSSLLDNPYFYYGPHELQAVRKGAWKLHIITSSQTGRDYFNGKLPLLFNLETDPSEQYDLSDARPDMVQELMAEIEQHKKAVAAEGSFWGVE